jgi:hypothetical protein
MPTVLKTLRENSSRMTLKINAFALSIALAAGLGCHRRPPPASIGLVDYLPFGVETLFPVQMQTVERNAHAHILITRRDFGDLRQVLAKAGPGTFEENYVRLKLRLFADGSETFVDNYGGVRTAGADKKLSPSQLLQLEEIVERAAAKAGIRPEFLKSRLMEREDE